MTLIKASNLHKVYPNGKQRLHILKGVELSIEAGQVEAIIGPSGAGKSTLLHILGGLDEPTEGRVLFDGIDLYKIGDDKRSLIRNKRIGFVFQFYHLLPEFSAVENVLMPALIRPSAERGRRRLWRRAEELLETVGLKARMKHKPSELSGGEAQRVAIARALMNEPDIVFCDEPTGNLDSKSSELILGLISDLNKEKNQTFLIVTHNEELADFANRVIHIKDGILV